MDFTGCQSAVASPPVSKGLALDWDKKHSQNVSLTSMMNLCVEILFSEVQSAE